MSIGQVLEDARRRVHINKSALEKTELITWEGYRLIIRGKRTPTTETLEGLIKLFKIPRLIADRLRQEVELERAMKRGLDVEEIVSRSWSRYREFLLDEGADETMDMSYLEESFAECLRNVLPKKKK